MKVGKDLYGLFVYSFSDHTIHFRDWPPWWVHHHFLSCNSEANSWHFLEVTSSSPFFFFFWSHLYFKNSLTLKMDQFPPWFKIQPPCPSLYLLISSDLMLTLILSQQCFLALFSLEVLKFFYVMFREMLVHVTINSKTTVTSNKIIFLTLPS